MRKLNPLAILAVVLDILLLCICLFHLSSITDRAQVPFDIVEDGDRTLVRSVLDAHAAGSLETGDEIITWDSRPIRISEYVEFAADRESIGKVAHLGFRRAGQNLATDVVLVPYYSSLRFTIITGFVGLAFWLIGIFVLLSRPNDHVARVLHWSIILMATSIFLTQARIVPYEWFSLFNRCLLLLVYPTAGATFFYFSTLYPRPRFGSRILKGSVILGPAVIIAAICISFFMVAAKSGDPGFFGRFQLSYDACHFLLFLYGFGTVSSMVHSYVKAQATEERRKLQWIMWGFAVGPTPFIVLIILPQLLFSVDLVPEEYATLFLVVVPLSLAVSFLRYRAVDIGVLVNRSVVYFVLTIFIGAIYVAAVLLLASSIGGKRISDEYLLVIALSLIVAIVLNPLRHGVQRFVNETLFPARSRYRELVRTISSEIHTALTVEQLFKVAATIVQRLLPVSSVAVYSYGDGLMSLRQIAHANPLPLFQLSEQHARGFTLSKVYVSSSATSFRRSDVDSTRGDLLEKLGFSAGIPLRSESGQLLGILLINPRLETRRFDEGEIDLLKTIGQHVEEALDRLQLQERLILEREGKKHAEELNKLKSNFVASVSHELRTPLTSIRMFADTLRETKEQKPRKRKEYLNIIIGETDRLARLINNVLDFSKIESGLKEFHFAEVDSLDVIRRSVDAMRYQIEMNGGTIRVKTPKMLPCLTADGDALEEVFVNLLSNALKYSTDRKQIALTGRKRGTTVEFAVTDKGLGIAEADLPHVFERFFRVRDEQNKQVGGAGIGLAVVQHIVEAHGGTITVTSKEGKGSMFVVRLPIKRVESNL
jgi:signal transduction histidine kinase